MYSSALKSRFLNLALLVLLICPVLFAACGEEKARVGAAVTATQTVQPPASSKPAGSPFEITSASEVPLDSTFTTEVSRLLPATKNLSARLYVSDTNPEKLAADFDKAVTTKGYAGLAEKPKKTDKTYVGIYTRTGSDDLILVTLDAPKDATQLSKGFNLPGLSESAVNNIFNQVKGKTSLALMLSGQDLVKGVLNASTQTPGTINSRTVTPTAAPVVTPRVEITAPPSTTLPVAAVPGSELVGKLIATESSDLKVRKVEGYRELSYEGKTVKPAGVFVVITYDYANISKKPIALTFLVLKDGQGHEYDATTDPDVSNALIKLGFHSSFVVNPGFKGSEYRVYDLPISATGFVLESFIATDRQPSEASFASNGGKGPESGAGPELVGKSKTIESEKIDVKITGVERVSAIKDGSKSLTTDGAFLIVTYEYTNKGDKEAYSPLFYLEDAEGRIFSSTDNFDVIFAVAASAKTKYDSSVKPGQSGISYRVFEVLKESGGLKPVEIA